MKLVGILSPDGEFYECEPYGHMTLSRWICEEKGISLNGLYGLAEDALLKNNYIVFRAKDCYKSFWNEKGCRIYVTEQQLKFILSNKGNWNNDSQALDVLDILKDDGLLREYGKAE